MKSWIVRFLFGPIVGAVVVLVFLATRQQAEASCGAVTCFVVIGSEQQVSPKGLLTVNAFYSYTPLGTLLPGTTGVIPAISPDTRQLILNHHREIRTITQTYTLDLNYGLTDRLGLDVNIPYLRRKHQHIDGLGEAGGAGEGELTRFSDNGIGDIRITLKYNVLPTLRSMVVTGFGIQLPTGDSNQRTAAAEGKSEIMESTAQLGRGNLGLIGSVYQMYELIPHRLSQFAFASYRHTFRNNLGYQFGDEYLLNAGVNLVTVPWLTLTSQFNYRYLVHDNFSSSLYRSATPADGTFPDEPIAIDTTIKDRPVPTTGSTFLAYSPGFQLSLGDTTRLYFFASIPVARDFNNNLAQGVSYTFGVTQYFQVPSL